MIAYNNLALTQKAVESVLAQDIPVDLYFVDNGSTDGTWSWVETQPLAAIYRNPSNESVVKIANRMAALILKKHEYCLAVPNDVLLPPNCYSQLLRWPRGFVSASLIEQDDPFQPDCVQATAVSENTPMAVMLVRKWAYDALVAKDGFYLDEGYAHYASDCDLALRMAACGIHGVQLSVPVWHYRSASHRLAPRAEGRAMELQADADRAYFEKKWGFKVFDDQYAQKAIDLNFTGAPK
jgi:GT2 family glycosyltransferase